MKIIQTSLNKSFVIKPEEITDKRGIFTRIFCEKKLNKILDGKRIVQINHSLTRSKGTLRGLHFQHPPKAEIKLVRCLRGRVFDVLVDLRKYSKTFLKWYGTILSGENMKMINIPAGFAHGFQTLEQNCEMLYLHTEFYSPLHEGGIRYDDLAIGIKWPLEITEISEKDRNYTLLAPEFSGIVV